MNKVALITGSSRGLGRQIALEFAKKGYNVVINFKNEENKAQEVSQIIESEYGVSTLIIKADISNEQEVKNMIELIKDKFEKLDVLVNNAGIANDSPFFDKTKSDFLKVYETNLVGPFLCAKYASQIMDESSSIINISSTNADNTHYPYSADYDASKAALISLTNNLAVELAPIRVNAVLPGWINTEMNQDLDSEYIKEECNKILLKRFADVTEIAKVVVFLCSPDASYINKSTITVDGGYYG